MQHLAGQRALIAGGGIGGFITAIAPQRVGVDVERLKPCYIIRTNAVL
jgi:hypothetical protein